MYCYLLLALTTLAHPSYTLKTDKVNIYDYNDENCQGQPGALEYGKCMTISKQIVSFRCVDYKVEAHLYRSMTDCADPALKPNVVKAGGGDECRPLLIGGSVKPYKIRGGCEMTQYQICWNYLNRCATTEPHECSELCGTNLKDICKQFYDLSPKISLWCGNPSDQGSLKTDKVNIYDYNDENCQGKPGALEFGKCMVISKQNVAFRCVDYKVEAHLYPSMEKCGDPNVKANVVKAGGGDQCNFSLLTNDTGRPLLIGGSVKPYKIRGGCEMTQHQICWNYLNRCATTQPHECGELCGTKLNSICKEFSDLKAGVSQWCGN
ncbi:hypothetical protein BC833DRAFT_597633 [Globomyces pollinis-pini]|nr:hypothetical protein BC833DRAFT_597633 [Globomyces pollinis-pini]